MFDVTEEAENLTLEARVQKELDAAEARLSLANKRIARAAQGSARQALVILQKVADAYNVVCPPGE